ncbi:uncharacterized protein G2W53_004778 [Senna tora]|uniref:Uncharacterized protein n=1 Tax=Senna tora TaxID=362788 RepID=A0A834XDM0_9FABA|nr:uncharacterized protein G2W53_004778 [Senna tora]
MPVSGNEETGVKSFAEQFSGLIAGVPIKKRRFPLIHPSSTLPEEQCSLTEETELLRKEKSTSRGPALSSSTAGAPIKKRRFPLIPASPSPLEEPCSPPKVNEASHKEYPSTSLGSTLSTSCSVLSDRSPAFDERKAKPDVKDVNMVQSKSFYLRPKLEEPNVATCSSALDVADSKEKLINNQSYEKNLQPQMMKENPELLLAAKESLALNIGADIAKQIVEEKCKQENPAATESTNLSLGLKQHLFPAKKSLAVDESFQKIGKEESVSLKLSLSKEGSSKNFNSDAKTNRANWDLNTTMDAWEESGSNGMKVTGSARNEKHFMCSTGMQSIGSASLQKINAGSQSNDLISSKSYGQQYKSVNPRNHCFASGLQEHAGEQSRLLVKQNDFAVPTVSLPNTVACASDINIASVRRVKSEPSDDNPKRDLKEARPCQVRSSDAVTVKHELLDPSNVKSFKYPKGSNVKLFDPKSIESEVHEKNLEKSKTTESKSDQRGEELPHRSDYCSATGKPITLETLPISAETACPPVKAACSAELSTSGSVVSHLENHVSIEGACLNEKASHGTCSSDDQIPPETVAIAKPNNATESSDPGIKKSLRTMEENVDDPEGCRLKLMNELPLDTRGSGEGCGSDDEKITLLADMLEGDSYGFDYESDGAHVDMDIDQYGDDDDYEDGEVREPLEHSAPEDIICEVREVERTACSNYDSNQIEKGMVSVGCPTSSLVKEKDKRTLTQSETNCDKDGVDIESNDKSDIVTDNIVRLQESVEDDKPIVGSLSERKNVLKASKRELLSDRGNDESREADVAQCAVEVVKNLDMANKVDTDLPKMAAFVKADDSIKDVCSGGIQGRIINLSRATSSSPTKSRPISTRGLPSRAGRDPFSGAYDHEKLHGGRDEVYFDGPHKFSRERHQDMSPRHPRLNFVRGRGRFNSRMDTHRGEWDSDREFAGQFYNGPNQFRAPRHKYTSAVHDADLKYNNVSPDSSYAGTSRVNRKTLNDEGPLGRHITSRRRSPRGRESMQIGHRIPRTMSPSRCVGGDGSEFVGIQHSEKFMRGFPEDPVDPMFTRPQPFDRLGGRFTRGSRNFSIQRRVPPRIHSKSPIRSRSRSPLGLWSSPRRRSPRRSPNEFGGHPDLAHRRSPLYRDGRMRSPVFSGERVVRRHVSPSFVSRPSNDIRNTDSGRNHGHPRSVTSNRSPVRILVRNRRFDVVDPQDRVDNDEYFGSPMHSGRILELNGEGNGDERRRFGERRGPVRSFRPPFNGGASNNFHLDPEDGPRHYRFCADDSDFNERGNMRDGDFDRRIKSSRPENVPPSRTRDIYEQEANFRNGGQVWSDDGFDDISRAKRKRF